MITSSSRRCITRGATTTTRQLHELSSSRQSTRQYHGLCNLSSLFHMPMMIQQQRNNDDNDDESNRKITVQPINIINTKYNYQYHHQCHSLSQPHHQTYQQNLQIRKYHTTPPTERGAAIVLTFGAIAATAKAGQYALQGYREWKVESDRLAKEQAELDATENAAKMKADGSGENASESAKADDAGGENTAKTDDDASSSSNAGDKGSQSTQKKKEGKRENIFASFFNMSVGSKYYEGGFEDKMTRKEAALILGVRESSAVKRIKEAHRKLLILNHPDTGGSTFLAGKINEAKELLLKGKK